jgi:cytidine deaminase
VTPGQRRRLIAYARAAREHAYAPYSRYRVGAAVLSEHGRIHTGCNVENASYGATLCAERAAVAALVASGARRVRGIAIATGGPRPGMPCGICRQVLHELGPDVEIIAVTGRRRRITTLRALLPEPFGLRRR